MLQKFCHKQNVQCWRKQKEVILKGINETKKVCNGLNQENFNVNVDKVLGFC